MERTQQAPHAGQFPQEGCRHEQQEGAGGYKQEEGKMAGQENQARGADMSMGAQQFQGQAGGAGMPPFQPGYQYMQPSVMAEQGQNMVGPAGPVFQGMAGGQHTVGQACTCQGNMEGAPQYGAPHLNMPPAAVGQHGAPPTGYEGQAHIPIHAAYPGHVGQYGQAGPMTPPYVPAMSGMAFQGYSAPQQYGGPQIVGYYGPQTPGQQGFPQQAMPIAGYVPAYADHTCGGHHHPGQGGTAHASQHVCHDQHQYQYGQLMDIVGDMMAGNPDASKILGFFQNCDTQFLKGVLIGAVGMFLLSNETVKNTIINMISGVWGTFQKEPAAAADAASTAGETAGKTGKAASK